MHPEVRREGPGKCPKCGMALEEQSEKRKEENSRQTFAWLRYWPLIVMALLMLIS